MNTAPSKNDDKAGQEYWNTVWNDMDNRAIALPGTPDNKDRVEFFFHDFFLKNLPKQSGLKILEIGCANSIWLPYFKKVFDYDIYGLDYSEIGCQQARKKLKTFGLDAPIYCHDFFSPPEDLLHQFDIVISFGVVEHFQDTSKAINAKANFLKPGGLLVTEIPNMKGLPGIAQKFLKRDVYDIHVPLNKRDLEKSHSNKIFDVKICQYLCFMNAGVMHIDPNKKFIKMAFNLIFGKMSSLILLIEKRITKLPANPLTSPYIFCIAKKL